MEKQASIDSTQIVHESIPEYFYSNAGLKVLVNSEKWNLAAYGKGHSITVSWITELNNSPELQVALLELLIFYSEKKSANTVATVNFALSAAFKDGSGNLTAFQRNWANLNSSSKKTLKGSLGNATKYGITILRPYYEVANVYKHKPKFNGLHPTKGRLTNFEYDTILEGLRGFCDSLPHSEELSDDFFLKKNSAANSSWVFSTSRNVVCYRTLIQLARRPKQISFLKWSDILPIGTPFDDELNEPVQTNVNSLHVRSFLIKQANSEDSFRRTPEKWTIPLSESFSILIIKYKQIFVHGLKLALKRQKVDLSKDSFFKMLSNMPVFPYDDIFKCDFKNEQLRKNLFSNFSSAFHVSEANIDKLSSSYGKGLSERHGSCEGANNRLRHTWLCNAALEGLPVNDICKITNVSQPAARYYLQLGLNERQFIDEHYAANAFLRDAFSPKLIISESDRKIVSEVAGCVGVERDNSNCDTCTAKKQMNRPIPCYGCPNFRPLLDADHGEVLKQALAKRAYLSKISSPEIGTGSIKKLDKCISYIKLTIEMCGLINTEQKSLTFRGEKV